MEIKEPDIYNYPEPDIHKIIFVAAEAGRIMMENGGETYRVEETILKVCESFGAKDAESFVTPTGIMLSAIGHDGRTVSLIKRIRKRTTNLEKISKVNDISRRIRIKNLTISMFEEHLIKIDRSKSYSNKLNILSASVGTACFTIVFGGNMYDFGISFGIGGIVMTISILLGRLEVNNFFINIVGGAVIAFLAMLFTYSGLPIHSDKIIIGSVMLLVPGLAITNAIRDTIAGDIIAGTARAVEAFLVAIAIAVGTGSALKLFYILFGGKPI